MINLPCAALGNSALFFNLLPTYYVKKRTLRPLSKFDIECWKSPKSFFWWPTSKSLVGCFNSFTNCSFHLLWLDWSVINHSILIHTCWHLSTLMPIICNCSTNGEHLLNGFHTYWKPQVLSSIALQTREGVCISLLLNRKTIIYVNLLRL